LADLPSALRPVDPAGFIVGPMRHNRDLVERYAAWRQVELPGRAVTQTRTWVSRSKVSSKEYADGPVAMIGEVHRWLVVNKEQMAAPLERRNIVVMRDVFSESTTRLTARQKRHDSTINFYKFPAWMRDAARSYVLEKIDRGECGPATADGVLATLGHLRDFMCTTFESPDPRKLTRTLIEDDYIAWGKGRGLRGRNWFDDVVAFLVAAARHYPGRWPMLGVDKRAVRKLSRQMTYPSEHLLERSVDVRSRAMPARVVDAIASRLSELPSPCPLLFLLAITVGARAEDLHALLFDAIRPDPDDDRFEVLHFWQNKVSRWNTKPLLKSDPLHAQLLTAVERQREAIVMRHGSPTKYLFPIFHGTMEGFCTQHWSVEQFRRLCVDSDIRGDNDEVYRFGWHALRHYRGTQMAQQGHDILAIMLELGHVSPDMAMTYVNRRLDLKKKALLEKGGGRFVTIAGDVDSHVGELLLKKDAMVATRVAGGV
jgi:integrase